MLNEVKSRLISGKKLIFFSFIFLVSYNAYSQDITNTLGTNGEFIITDGSTTFLTLSQDSGLIKLPYSLGSTNGSIFKGGNRFLHTYAPSGAYGCNTFLGIKAGNFSMSYSLTYDASYNTGIGYSSLYSNTSGLRNTAVGFNSLRRNTTGRENTAVGSSSLYNNTVGFLNTALGSLSLYSNTEGFYNTAVGYKSLYSNTTSDQNTAIGCYSLFNNTGGYNTAIGYESLRSNTTGWGNTAVGNNSLYKNSSGHQNTAVGYKSLDSNTTGIRNTAIGYESLSNNTTGWGNTVLGYQTGQDITTGQNNTLIGFVSEPSTETVNNEITLGNSSVTALRCNVPYIASLSDARDKKNINDLSLGLDFITQLKPRQFKWDKREWYEDNKSDGSKMEEKLTAGFIAQELDEVQQSENAEWMDLVYKSNPEKLEATTGNLLPVMVKAIQELKTENDELKEKLAKFEQMQNILVNEIEKLNSKDGVVTEVKEGNDND